MNRKERRAANSGKPKKKVIVRSEVYELIGKGGKLITLDIEAMRRWAEEKADRVALDLRVSYVERLIARGAITVDRVNAIMEMKAFRPVLLCKDINDDGDEIVDGNHTYAAMVFSRELDKREGTLAANSWAYVRAYQLYPDQWKKFVVRQSAVVRTKPSA